MVSLLVDWKYRWLDRYQRQGITFVFDQTSRQFYYDGASWREILRHYPRRPEAAEAQKQLAGLAATTAR